VGAGGARGSHLVIFLRYVSMSVLFNLKMPGINEVSELEGVIRWTG
jgi:hypothetical protein